MYRLTPQAGAASKGGSALHSNPLSFCAGNAAWQQYQLEARLCKLHAGSTASTVQDAHELPFVVTPVAVVALDIPGSAQQGDLELCKPLQARRL